ncbi:hypothetical protein FOCG_18608 [Fusarium oxysporum f. sp. radicis-lycopersici 26381]|nr:hypothetical protein FOCG_18608 [Fusarium oxysporum f. sp. radicis-lycopersici 26381]
MQRGTQMCCINRLVQRADPSRRSCTEAPALPGKLLNRSMGPPRSHSPSQIGLLLSQNQS